MEQFILLQINVEFLTEIRTDLLIPPSACDCPPTVMILIESDTKSWRFKGPVCKT